MTAQDDGGVHWLRPLTAPELRNIKIEQALLGALLAQCELVDHIGPGFHVEHYGDPLHSLVHEAVAAERSAGRSGPVALETLHRLSLEDDEKRKYLFSLVGAFLSLAPNTIAAHARVVTDMWKRREAWELGKQLTFAATSDQANPIDAAIVVHMLAVNALMGRGDGGIVPIGVSADRVLEQAQRMALGGSSLIGLSTGLSSVDDRTGGLEHGTMNVLGGRPGSGKSSLGWQIAHTAARAGKKVLGFSLEMSTEQILRRLSAAQTKIPLNFIRRGQLSQAQFNALVEARNELADLPLQIDDTAGLTAAEILVRAKIATRKMKGPLDLIVLDHLHIIKPEASDVRAGATWAVGKVSVAMKLLAKETGAAVLVLAQLNRANESREDKRPTLADLRQAGDIEQDADNVMLLHRPEMYLGTEPPERRQGDTADKHQQAVTNWEAQRVRTRGLAELICPKVREGEPGTVLLDFFGPTTSFAERN